MIKYEVIKRMSASQMDYPYYTLCIDRVMITLRPRTPPGYRRVQISTRVDDGAFTFTDLARSLPETVYSANKLGYKILETQQADIRELIVSHLFSCYRSSSDDKRRILLNLKSDINTTDLFKKSLDLLAERGKVFPISMEFHLMSLGDLLNLFSGSEDDDADAARAKLLTLCA